MTRTYLKFFSVKVGLGLDQFDLVWIFGIGFGLIFRIRFGLGGPVGQPIDKCSEVNRNNELLKCSDVRSHCFPDICRHYSSNLIFLALLTCISLAGAPPIPISSVHYATLLRLVFLLHSPPPPASLPRS